MNKFDILGLWDKSNFWNDYGHHHGNDRYFAEKYNEQHHDDYDFHDFGDHGIDHRHGGFFNYGFPTQPSHEYIAYPGHGYDNIFGHSQSYHKFGERKAHQRFQEDDYDSGFGHTHDRHHELPWQPSWIA